MITTVIADDEPLARARLRSLLAVIDDVTVVGEADNGIDALRCIQVHGPQLAVLDVHMPGLSGFQVLDALTRPPHVVFATAYDEYAIRAFEVDAIDYLLKPVSQARVVEAVARARQRIERGDTPGSAEITRPHAAQGEHAPPVRQIPVQCGRRILVLPTDTILWFGVDYRIVHAHVEGRTYMTNYTLKQLEDRLDPETFFRAHKSALVNLDHIREIVPRIGGRHSLVMGDAARSEVALSRSQARALRARLRW
jgi:DNA-binding LytR/AlgR family response regulator